MAKILLIQRERIFLTMYGHALVKANHEVIGRDDFESGRKVLEAIRPSVVICGFHREITDGDLDEIRALREARPEVPIIVLSYRAESTPVFEAMRAGASMVLRQHVSNAQLAEVIARVCEPRDTGRFSAMHERAYDSAAFATV